MAALITLLLVLLLVIMPVAFISGSLVREGANLYQSIKSGQLNFGAYFQQAMEALPPSVHDLLARFDLADIPSLQEKLSAGAMQVSQFLATQALSIGQDTFQFVISFGIMLYLLFFLLRDGPRLSARISRAIPLSETHKHHLLLKFTTVVRATVKGNIAVAASQGALGGIMFSILGIQGAMLWGVIMAFLSLLPAVGAGLIWAPVAIYFLDRRDGQGRGADPVRRAGHRHGGQHPAPGPGRQGHQDAGLRRADLHAGRHGLVRPERFRHRSLIAALFMACWDLFAPAPEEPAARPAEAPTQQE